MSEIAQIDLKIAKFASKLNIIDRLAIKAKVSLKHNRLKILVANADGLLAINQRVELLTLPALVPDTLAAVASSIVSPKADLLVLQPRALIFLGVFDTLVDGITSGAEVAAAVATYLDVVASATSHPLCGPTVLLSVLRGDFADVVELRLLVPGVVGDDYWERGGECHGVGKRVCEEHCVDVLIKIC